MSERRPQILLCALAVMVAWSGLVLHLEAMAGDVRLTMAFPRVTITGDLRQPSDVAVNSRGDIHVVDGVNNRIKVFSSSGRILKSFGSRGSGEGEFHYPLGIDLDEQGRIYVADSGNHRIQIFSPEGVFLSSLDLESSTGKPVDPTDVAVTRSGAIGFIVDNDNHCVLKYDLRNGHFLQKIGSPGIERNEFRYPFLISLHGDKYLHVVDVINTRVQVFTDTGKFVALVGDWGVEKGQFFRPKGVAVDENGLIYVSDSYMGVIQVFGPEGDFQSVVGDPANGKVRRFSTPVGLFIDEKNQLYVVEMFSDKVTVFTLEKP